MSVEEPDCIAQDGAAELLSAIAAKYQSRLGDAASVKGHWDESPSDIWITPIEPGALTLFVAGVGDYFVLSMGNLRRREEISNTAEGRSRLSELMDAAIEGYAWGSDRRRHVPYLRSTGSR